LVKALLEGRQDILSFFLEHKDEIAYLRNTLSGYLLENRTETQAETTQTVFSESSVEAYKEFNQSLQYALSYTQRIGKGIEKQCAKLRLSLPTTAGESAIFMEKLVPIELENVYFQYVHYALERDFYFFVAGVIGAQGLLPEPTQIQELKERLLTSINNQIKLAQMLGWLSKPKKRIYATVTEDALQDKTLKGVAKMQRDKAVIHQYIREGKDIRQLEEALNVKFS
jgi:hypothetical protein